MWHGISYKTTLLLAVTLLYLGTISACTQEQPLTSLDSDGDGWPDSQELSAGTSPHNKDTDADGYWDPQDPNPLDPNVPIKAIPPPAQPPAPAHVPTPTAEPEPISAPAPTSTLREIPEAGNGAWESDSGKMIDAHSHISGPNIDVDIEMDYVFSFLDQANISKIVLFGPPVPLQKVYRRYPDRVIPFLTFFRPDLSTGKLNISHERLELVESLLKSGLFKGIGEILVRWDGSREFALVGARNPADDPLLLKLYDLAAKYSVPVNVHVDFKYSDELERALEHNRKATIIWAHCGATGTAAGIVNAAPSLIRRMMDKHPNLFADLSLSNPYTLGEDAPAQEELFTNPDGSIKQEWKDLFEDYSDRFMWGLDMVISTEGYYEKVELTVKATNYYRSLLGQLSPEAAENIAYKNIERILPAH